MNPYQLLKIDLASVSRCLLGICLVTVLLGFSARAWANTEKNYPAATIQELKTKELPSGDYRTEGYVLDIRPCSNCSGVGSAQVCTSCPHTLMISNDNRRDPKKCGGQVWAPDKKDSPEAFVTATEIIMLNYNRKFEFIVRLTVEKDGDLVKRDLALVKYRALTKPDLTRVDVKVFDK